MVSIRNKSNSRKHGRADDTAPPFFVHKVAITLKTFRGHRPGVPRWSNGRGLTRLVTDNRQLSHPDGGIISSVWAHSPVLAPALPNHSQFTSEIDPPFLPPPPFVQDIWGNSFHPATGPSPNTCRCVRVTRRPGGFFGPTTGRGHQPEPE